MGFCQEHYRRRPRKTLEQKFWSKVDKRGPDECWDWLGSTFIVGGYGYIRITTMSEDRHIRAHRLSYELHYGRIPDDLHVHHRCFNVICVNPNHLSAETNQMNGWFRSGAAKSSKTGIRGVIWREDRGAYEAHVCWKGEKFYRGGFSSPEAAEECVIEMRESLERERIEGDET
jgi:hypothetical protein